MLDWGPIIDRANDRQSAVVLLSGTTLEMFQDMLTFFLDRWKWVGGEWDTIEADIAQAFVQIGESALIGSIVYSAGSVPPACLLCDGAQYDRVDYPRLYAVLDAQYILDADTFVVPDLREVFILGDDGGNLGATGGESDHTLVVSEMPAHSHTDAGHTHTEGIATPSIINGGLEAPAAAAIASASVTGVGYASIQSSGGDGAHNNMPPFARMLPCIVAY